VRLAELAKKMLLTDNGETENYPLSALIAIAESNSCAVDALQAVLGCTMGKGNLLINNGAQKEYAIVNRHTRRGVMIQMLDNSRLTSDISRFSQLSRQSHLSPEESIEKESLTGSLFETIMTIPGEQLFTWQHINVNTNLDTKGTKCFFNESCECPAWQPDHGDRPYA